jgi:outer membrane protein assembly factor BamA
MGKAVLSCCFILGLLSGLAAYGSSESVIELRFQGNLSIPDEEMHRLSGVQVGTPVSEKLLNEVRRRLMESGRFESVEVSRRYRSLGESEDVVLMIAVREKPSFASHFMFMPVLGGNDEYGMTYGGRLTSTDLLGRAERITIPLTWGGFRNASAEVLFPVENRYLDGVTFGSGISRKENPHFQIGDLRKEVWGGAHRKLKGVNFEFKTEWSDIAFADIRESHLGVDTKLSLDTRRSHNLPRDSAYAAVGWERMVFFGERPDLNIYTLDVRGYKGLLEQTVLAGQVLYQASDGRLPDYQRLLLGGSTTVRGHDPGAFAGDSLLLGSVEMRIPLNPTRAVYQTGLNFFFDSGTVFEHGRSLREASFKQGMGVGWFGFVLGFGIRVDFAYDLRDSFRVHFSSVSKF